MVQVLLHQYNTNSNASEMENVGDSHSKSNVRAINHFLHLKGIQGNDIHNQLCNVFKEGNVMSKCKVYQWIQRFDVGRVTMKDMSRPSRPRDSFNEDTIACICTILDKDCRKL